jgi:rubrerythrin
MSDGIAHGRRELVRRGVALVAAGATPFFLRTRDALAQADDDEGTLRAAIELEHSAAFAYTEAADSGKLGDSERVARLFATQEEEHARALARALEDLGGQAPTRPNAPADVPGLAEALAGGAAAITRFAIELETTAVAAYYAAHAKLRAPELLATVASIMANEAQHLVVLRQSVGENPSPDAFVTGR